MLILRANFPKGRTQDGELAAYDDGTLVAGPWPCSGRAANDAAARVNNPSRDPRLTYGDHPLGTWTLTDLVEIPERDQRRHSFGRWFIRLRPLSGEALEANRPGIGIHSGDPDHSDLDRDGRTDDLRRTHGCLRTTDEATDWLSVAWHEGSLTKGATYVSEVRA